MKKKIQIVFILLVSLIVFMPTVGTMLGMKLDMKNLENRRMNEYPSVPTSYGQVQDWARQFEAAFSDNFPFRRALVYLNGLMRYQVFDSSSSNLVFAGKQGWLFIDWGPTLPDMKGEFTVEPRVLRRWRIQLEERRDWLEQRGVEFLPVLIPMKQFVHQEFLPGWLTPLSKNSMYDQFVRHLKTHSSLNILDIRDNLLKDKQDHPLLYYAKDTHWNSLGALSGYQAIARALPKFIASDEIVSASDFTWNDSGSKPSNLMRMMGMDFVEHAKQPEFPEEYVFPRPVKGGYLGYLASKNCPVSLIERADKEKTLVYLGDSYMYNGYHQRFVGQHFKRASFVNMWAGTLPQIDNFPIKLFLEEKPDVVVYEMASGRIGDGASAALYGRAKRILNTPPVREARLKKLFHSQVAKREVRLFPKPKLRKLVRGNKEWRGFAVGRSGVGMGKYILRVKYDVTEKSVMAIYDGRGDENRLQFMELDKTWLSPHVHEAYITYFPHKDNLMVMLGIDNPEATFSVRSVEIVPHSDVTLPPSQYLHEG